MLNKLKGSLRSWVIWFNTFALSMVPVLQMAHDQLGELRQYLDAGLFKWIALVVIVGNIALRFKTSKGLEDK